VLVGQMPLERVRQGDHPPDVERVARRLGGRQAGRRRERRAPGRLVLGRSGAVRLRQRLQAVLVPVDLEHQRGRRQIRRIDTGPVAAQAQKRQRRSCVDQLEVRDLELDLVRVVRGLLHGLGPAAGRLQGHSTRSSAAT
jgi:hypothetical protein